MNEPKNPPKPLPGSPANAREMLESLHADVRTIQQALSIPTANAPQGSSNPDPAIELLTHILKATQDCQSSLEAVHQRLDTVVRFIPGAARRISGQH